MRRSMAVAMLTVAAAASLAAQQAPRFRTGVDLLVVPVVARGADNTFRRGLTQDDFELLEDGKPVAITTFAAVNTDAATSLDDGRFIVLLLDDLGTHHSYISRIKGIAHGFASRMGPKDVMMVVLLNGSNSFTTQQPGEVHAAIDRMKAIGKAAVAPGLNVPRHAMQTISNISTQLARVVHRRKVLIAIGPAATFNPPMQRTSARYEAEDAVRDSAGANLAAYVIDPLGLTSRAGLAARPVDGVSRDPQVIERGRGFELLEDGFAFETGGAAFANTNQYERAIDQVWEESGNYYLLGYDPARRDNRRHSIEVRVSTPGVAVRARRLR